MFKIIESSLLFCFAAHKCEKLHSSCLEVKVEAGSQLTPELKAADVLVADWKRGRPAACDITVTSPPTQAAFLNDAGTASAVAKSHKHVSKGPNCQELGRVCVPLAVETYGN